MLWNTYALWQLKKLGSKKDSSIQDEKYFDLKYRIQLFAAIFSIIIVGIGFAGYETYSDVKGTLTKGINKKIENLDTNIAEMNTQIVEMDSILDKNKKFIDVFEKEKAKMQIALFSSEEEFQELTNEIQNNFKIINNDIELLANKNIQNPDIYIIRDYEFNYEKREKLTIYYKNLTTVTDKKLPQFEKPPLLIIPFTRGIELYLRQNTKDYFVIERGGEDIFPNEDKNEKATFDIWIAYY